MMLVACDQIFDLTPVTLHDAAPPDPDGPPDAPPDAPPPDGPGELGFMMFQPVTPLNTSSSEGDPTLTSDRTEIYFKSRRGGGAGVDDIWYSTRAAASDAWSTPALSQLSTSEEENQPRIAPDGLTIWFRRGTGTTAKLMVSTRGTAKNDSLWSTPVQLTEFDATSTGPGHAQLMSTSPTQVVGYMISTGGSSSSLHIFRTTRASSTSPWGTPEEVPELVGASGYSKSPWATPDDLAIIFESSRPGCNGDLWLATRASTVVSFDPPICLGEVASLAFDTDPWISPDRRHIVFTSTASGNYDIFEANR